VPNKVWGNSAGIAIMARVGDFAVFVFM